MGVIFNEAEAVWEWLMTHLIVINLLFSIIIIFFQRRDPRSVWTWLFAVSYTHLSSSICGAGAPWNIQKRDTDPVYYTPDGGSSDRIRVYG